jgi:hypothetical protein
LKRSPLLKANHAGRRKPLAGPFNLHCSRGNLTDVFPVPAEVETKGFVLCGAFEVSQKWAGDIWLQLDGGNPPDGSPPKDKKPSATSPGLSSDPMLGRIQPIHSPQVTLRTPQFADLGTRASVSDLFPHLLAFCA